MVSENLFRTSLIVSLLVASLQLGAMRPLLHGKQLSEKTELLFQSLQKGPVTGSGHPCTEIPGSETGICELGGMNVACHVMHAPPPAFPGVVAEFGVASTAKGTSS